MPDLEIFIGGRSFTVSCQPGEEHFLRSAAAVLDTEAQPLLAQMGRLPETRMLLMAGLMLADKSAALEDEMRKLKHRLTELEQRPTPEPTRVEVPVVPVSVMETLTELAARAEAMADRIEDRAQPAAPV
jgi:cell division protein ZapA